LLLLDKNELNNMKEKQTESDGSWAGFIALELCCLGLEMIQIIEEQK
jgi:hypothetical protein